jgi:hypothetical protein
MKPRKSSRSPKRRSRRGSPKRRSRKSPKSKSRGSPKRRSRKSPKSKSPKSFDSGYCVKCKATRKMDHDDLALKTTKNDRLMLVGTCTTCGTRMNKFIADKDQEKAEKFINM